MRPLFQISGKNPTHRTSLNSFSMASLKLCSVCFSISFRRLSTPQAFLGSRTRNLSSNSFIVMGKSKGFWFALIDLSKLSSLLLIISFWLEFEFGLGYIVLGNEFSKSPHLGWPEFLDLVCIIISIYPKSVWIYRFFNFFKLVLQKLCFFPPECGFILF